MLTNITPIKIKYRVFFESKKVIANNGIRKRNATIGLIF